jgi:quinolinate synthase
MAMNRLSGINHLLDHWSQKSEILIDPALAEAAMKPLTRMLEFKASQFA